MKNTIVSETDLKGVITFASESFCRSSGYTKKELIGANHSIVRHPDNPKEFFEKLWIELKQGKTWKGVIKNKNKYGGTYEVNVTIGPKYSKRNDLIGYYALRHEVDNVINLKQNKLDEAFIKYTKILDNITSAVLILDIDDRVLDYNNYFLKMFNIDYIKVSKFKFANIYCDNKEYEKYERFKDIPTTLRTKPIITDFKRKDGEVFKVELSYVHLDAYQIMINIKDISSYINLSANIEELK